MSSLKSPLSKHVDLKMSLCGGNRSHTIDPDFVDRSRAPFNLTDYRLGDPVSLGRLGDPANLRQRGRLLPGSVNTVGYVIAPPTSDYLYLGVSLRAWGQKEGRDDK